MDPSLASKVKVHPGPPTILAPKSRPLATTSPRDCVAVLWKRWPWISGQLTDRFYVSCWHVTIDALGLQRWQKVLLVDWRLSESQDFLAMQP